jgi:hypothetical protein
VHPLTLLLLLAVHPLTLLLLLLLAAHPLTPLPLLLLFSAVWLHQGHLPPLSVLCKCLRVRSVPAPGGPRPHNGPLAPSNAGTYR